MKNFALLVVANLIFLNFGCNSTPVPVEFSKVCELPNNGKYLEVTGYLDLVSDLNCSGKKGEDMSCGMMFKKDGDYGIDVNKIVSYQLNPAEAFRVSVLMGDSANRLKKKEYARFNKEQMEFITNDNLMTTLKDKVKITGKAYVRDDPTIKPPGNPMSCSITVDKIEKQ